MVDAVEYPIDPLGITARVNRAHLSANENGLTIGWRVIGDFEFVLFTRGTGRYRILDRTFRYSAGDLILTPPYLRHRYMSSGGPSAHYALHFSLAPGFEEKFAGNAAMREEYRKVCVTYADLWTIPQFIPGVPDSIISLFQRIAAMKRDLRPSRILTADLRLQGALLEILAAVVEFGTLDSAKGPEAFTRSTRYIEEHFRDSIRVTDLAMLEGLSPNYFSTRFKTTFGIGINKYIIMRRLRHAKELLLETNEPIYTVAEKCGFTDPFYFSRLFREREGTSPSRYRMVYRGR